MEKCFRTANQTDKLFSRAIYPGGGIMYEYALRATQGIQVEPEGFHRGGRRWGITQEQKNGLVESLGIAPIRKKRWGLNVKIGFDGYNTVKTGQWSNKGQPNILIARVVESGTTFMRPQYFMERAVRAATPAIERAVESEFYDELGTIWGNK